MSETNIDFSDVFGPIDEGVNSDEGVQEPTEPANDDGMTEGSVEDNTEGEKEQEAAEPVKNQQSAEENAKYAAARREAERERDAAIAKMKAEHDAELDKAISALGLENPYTGKPVTNRAELEAYKKQHSDETRKQMQERAEEAGLSEEEIQNLVKSHPDYQQAMQIVNEAKAAKEAAEQEKAKNTLEAAIKEVHELDPSISSFEDLRQHESWSEVENRVRRGYTFADAFYFANRNAIEQRKMAAFEQQIRNSMNGKGHLDSSSPKGDGGITVPSDVIRDLKAWDPSMTDDEIRSWYAKDQARLKK
ncbi:MAG: hypothetical protein IJC82_04025 [Firmicutes bacterium]|nr:hypothetical protein [Bacillota bacterium]